MNIVRCYRSIALRPMRTCADTRVQFIEGHAAFMSVNVRRVMAGHEERSRRVIERLRLPRTQNIEGQWA